MQSKREEKTKKSEGFMKSVLILMVSQVLIKLLGFVYRVYLTNRDGFGDEGNAIYSGGYQIYALLLTISSIGVPNAISKLVSERVAVGDEKGAHRVFKIALMTFGVIGLIGTLILLLGAGYIANVILQIPESELTLVALSPAIFFVTIASVMRGYFNGRDRISATAKAQTLEQIFKTVLTIAVVEIIVLMYGKNVTIMAAGANLATTLSVLLSFGYLALYYKIYKRNEQIKTNKEYKPEKALKVVKNILFVSIPITLSAIMSTLNKNIDSITVVRGLKKFLSESEAKIQYGILSGKVDTLITLPLSFNIAFATALVPTISAAIAKNEHESASKRISLSLLVTMIIGLPCTFGMVVFAQPIINLIFPNAPSGSLLLQISALTIIFSVLAQTINGALQGLGKIMVPAISSFIGLVIKLILNVILISIPSIGVNGAAIGSIVNNFVVFVISYYILIKTIKLDIKPLKYVVKPVFATAIMCLCSYSLYIILIGASISGKIATLISLIFAVALYFISIIALKIFSREEMLMIPYGTKLLKMLEKLGIYKKEKIR